MADDLEAMLNTIGEKFDMSFDEPQQNALEEHTQQHASINPEIIQTSQGSILSSHLHSNTGKEKQSMEDGEQNGFSSHAASPSQKQEEQFIQTSFLSLLEKDDKEPQHQEIPNDKPQLIEGETAGHFQSEEQEMEYYRSLSEKFENALDHAKSRKSFTDFQGEFIERQQHYKKKKQTSLSMLLQQKQRREKGQIRTKPLINSYSQQILNQYTPIDKRYPAVITQRNKKVEMWQNEQRKKEEQAKEEEKRQMEKWAEMVKQRVGTVRSNQDYYSDMKQWVEKRDKNIQQHIEKKEEAIKADISFRPKINQRSDKMMRKKPDRIPIYQKQPQLKKLPVDQQCTFKPNLSKVLRKKE